MNVRIIVFLLGMAAAPQIAQAQYRPPPRREAAEEYDDSFDREISLDRFRRGNPDWDTQELVASGFNALHKEHQQILEKLDQLEERLLKMERNVKAEASKRDYETAP